MNKEIEQQVRDAIKQSPLSMLEASKISGMPHGTFKYRAQKLGLYKPNQSHKGQTFPEGGKGGYSLSDIFDGKHPTYKTRSLKQRMLNEGMLKEVCTECGLKSIWNGKPIVLELDHINGINNDHSRDNLRLLCPNCHSQTPTFRGRKTK